MLLDLESARRELGHFPSSRAGMGNDLSSFFEDEPEDSKIRRRVRRLEDELVKTRLESSKAQAGRTRGPGPAGLEAGPACAPGSRARTRGRAAAAPRVHAAGDETRREKREETREKEKGKKGKSRNGENRKKRGKKKETEIEIEVGIEIETLEELSTLAWAVAVAGATDRELLREIRARLQNGEA